MISPTISPTLQWRLLGASVTGTSHQKTGRGCDDFHAYHQVDNGTLLIAVADGAGSASYPAEGASSAVQESLSAAKNLLAQHSELANEERWYPILRSIMERTRTAVEELALGKAESPDLPTAEAVEKGPEPGFLPLREFATTLLFAIVTSQWIAVAQIGDGAVVIQQTDGPLLTLTQPDHGEYINETHFITDHDYLKHAQYRILPQTRIQGVALLTDGLQMLALDFATNKPHEPFFTPMFRFAASPDAAELELETFLRSERVCAHTDDDKTLVLAVRS